MKYYIYSGITSFLIGLVVGMITCFNYYNFEPKISDIAIKHDSIDTLATELKYSDELSMVHNAVTVIPELESTTNTTWYCVFNEGNPFEQPESLFVYITDYKDGYVKYIEHNRIESRRADFFNMDFKFYKDGERK